MHVNFAVHLVSGVMVIFIETLQSRLLFHTNIYITVGGCPAMPSPI